MRRSILALTAVLLGLVAAPGIAGPFDGEETTRTPIAGAVRKVVLDVEAGSLTVGVGRSPSLTVHEQWEGERPEVTVTHEGGVLTVTGRCFRATPAPISLGIFNCAINVDVVIASGAAVSADTSAGSIAVTRMRGDQALDTSAGSISVSDTTAGRLGAHSSSGSIDVTRTTAHVLDADTSSGGVRLLEVASKYLTVESSSGAITATTRNRPAKVQLTGSAGSIDLAVPSGRYAISARTSAGQVVIERITNDSRSANTIQVRTSSGNVTVRGR